MGGIAIAIILAPMLAPGIVQWETFDGPNWIRWFGAALGALVPPLAGLFVDRIERE